MWRSLLTPIRMRLFLVFGFLVAAASYCQAQSAPASIDTATIRRVGADEHGMKSYVFVLLKRGANKDTSKAKRREAFNGHFSNMKRLSEEGKLMLAGPYDDATGDWAGLFILDVRKVEDAKPLVLTDPAVKAGYLSYELHSWYGSAAVSLIPKLHPTLQAKPW